MADRFRRMPFAAEMDSFKAEVGRDQRFVPRWNAENGTVIADSGNKSRRAAIQTAGLLTNARDQLSFRQGQGGMIA